MSKAWQYIIEKNLNKDRLTEIISNVDSKRALTDVYPPKDEVFNFLKLTAFDDIKVVIIGQDPYHQPGQANGLAFSVNDGIKFPPSLRNIFIELNSDLGIDIPKSGNLTSWAKQGVFLINSTLTVEKSQPNSHSKFGWDELTDFLIEYISDNKENVVFILLGKFAQLKRPLIKSKKHLILETSHPSPFSVRRGFFGSKIFSKTNEYLLENGITPIDWRLS
ncbi:MAG: uracil-DNA glycosylase [Tissierellia bacterium]|nr:uracil-DNA glycosylase [Tissierellia bacterium]